MRRIVKEWKVYLSFVFSVALLAFGATKNNLNSLQMSNKFLVNDRLARFFGIPLLSLSITLLLKFGHPDFFKFWIVAFVHALVTWEGCRMLFFFFRKQFPNYHQTLRRTLVQGGAMLIYTLLVAVLMYSIRNTVFPDPTTLLSQFFNTLFPTICVTLAYESVVFFQDWKRNVQKTESLARENVQSQLEVLKNQLDPHFLFNSHNTLASLIDFENVGAQQYLERLSDVYRYVLLSRERNTVPLEEEVAFLDAYVYLNKVRFRDNLQVVKEISPEAFQKHVAPLSLQMLVENAIKHNVASRERPLKIHIIQEGESCLLVVNNLQEKTIFEKSTKVGLRNISNRYQLLSDQQVEISKEEGLFKVRLPLLQSKLAPVAMQ